LADEKRDTVILWQIFKDIDIHALISDVHKMLQDRLPATALYT